MPSLPILASLLPFCLTISVAGTAQGQNYPVKPIRIVTAEAGGGGDIFARSVAPDLTASLGQQVIVENRGGSAIVPARIVVQAPADGYTVLQYGNPLWLLPFMRSDVPYDPLRDFQPITFAVRSPLVLVVNAAVPVKSVKDLIALAKAKPQGLNYASGPNGSSPHLSAELFKSMAGINLVQVSYKGTATALNEVIGSQVQMMFSVSAPVMPHVNTGRLRALAVTSALQSSLLPGIPAMAAALPGYEAVAIIGLFAQTGTPAAIISLLHRELVRAMIKTEVKERFASAGSEILGGTPAELAAAVKADMARMGKLIKDVGIRAD